MAMKKKLDFTNVSEGFETLPKGVYDFYVFEMKEGLSQAGNEKMDVILKVADGEHKGRQVWSNLTFVETAMFKIREFLIACGAEVPKKAVDIDFSKCIGKKIRAEVYHRPNKNDPEKPYADIKQYFPKNSPKTDSKNDDTPPATIDSDEIPFK
jgi:hypothetical protein